VTKNAFRLGACLACAIAAAACDLIAPDDAFISRAHVTQVAPLVHVATIELARPERVTIAYGPPEGPTVQVSEEGAQTRHTVLLTRLRSNTSYRYTVHAGEDVLEGAFSTGAIDADLAALDFQTEGRAVHPLTLLEVNDGTRFRGAVVIDDSGEVVWYHRTQGALTGSTVRADGNFVFVDLVAGLVEVTPTGEVVAQLPQSPERSIHHDVLETESGSLLFLATDPREVDGRTIVGDAIWEWRPGADATRRWSAFDHLSPDTDWALRSRPADWLHANSLSVGPRGNHLVSLNFLNQIVSLTPDFTTLEWRLGGVNATVTVGADGAFSGQHTATELSDGRVMMFDNGFERSEPFSRGLILEVSGDKARVQEDLRPNPRNWSRAISSALRAADGTTLILYGLSAGAAGSTGPIEAFAYDAGASAPAWHLRVPEAFSVYRATPLETIAGETTVR
jgi:hypothetical protein